MQKVESEFRISGEYRLKTGFFRFECEISFPAHLLRKSKKKSPAILTFQKPLNVNRLEAFDLFGRSNEIKNLKNLFSI
ncbi:hypothetical protein LEP1GSC161_3109 [Leptospira santarosai str. CBC1416]|uniref:Uncharacterized protein n=1 Tax=Leptospira santarosai str. CBC1416 TaxID=1193059 RepID=M6VJ22_9LEPT|nr:hypothetical protein LEP1GSC161_3109 [Leptospira santarosai str. CBC1416]